VADDQSTAQALAAPTKVSEAPLVSEPVSGPTPKPISETPEPPVETLKTTSSASRRVRARLARRMTAQRSALNPVLEPLVAVHREIYPKANLSLLQRAFEVADQRHASQLRHSGDPYITHPLAVANILAELGMDTTTLVAALLHDTVEDTGYTLEALSEEFGEEVGHLVDGVTKLDRVELGNAAEGETIRKMITAMARDPRVLVIKVADRLHNMRTMRFLPPEKQARKSRETLEVIAPLAHRLGMASVKWELEDLSFAILHPKKYDEIVRLVAGRAPSRDTYLAKVRVEIVGTLNASKIKATVEGRPKHYWSIYQKMIVKGRDFDDIHDLVGLRILCDEIRDCYAAVGVVHSLWQPMAGRFKDYIAQPRYGVYQSLHTTVVGPEGKPLEVQIRTRDMHRTAEYGIAAHWRYKEAKGRNGVPHPHAAAEIDDLAGRRCARAQPLDDIGIMPARHEADILAVVLLGNRQPIVPGKLAGFRLGAITQREAQEVELVLGGGEQEIALVAGRVAAAMKLVPRGARDPTRIVAGGERGGVQPSRHVQQVAELHRLVAAHARDGGLAAGIGVGEVLDHRLPEAGLVVEHVVGNADGVGGRAGVQDVLAGAAGALAADRGAVVVKLERDADHLIARARQQGRGDRRIHPSRHGRDDSRPDREVDSEPRRVHGVSDEGGLVGHEERHLVFRPGFGEGAGGIAPRASR